MNRSTTEARIRDIELSQIDRSRNHRIPMQGDAERIESLKQSIEACGQLQAIRVYERGSDQKTGKNDKPYILSFGDRRCAAIALLGRKTVRAAVFAPASQVEIAQARAIENLHRQDITPLEEVRAVSDVLEAVKAEEGFKGDPYEEAATRLARSVAWVKDRDYLHRLTKQVQRFALRSGLPAGHLRELAKLGDAKEQLRLACDSVGAPSWCFPAVEGDAAMADHARRLQEGYFAELADGKVNRWPLSRLKMEVGKVQFSLKVVPWEYDKPIAHGDVKLRRCAGCPHNSETDRTLFGLDEDAANPRGFCLNSGCYNAKQAAAEDAKEQALKKIAKRPVQTPEAIRKVSPPWMKEAAVVGYVKRQLEKAERNGGQDSAETRKPERSYGGRTLTDYELALNQFRSQLEAWDESAWASVMTAINGEPQHRVSWCVLLGVNGFWDHPRIRVPRVSEYSSPSTEEPIIPAVAETTEQAIGLAFKGTRSGWMELLAGHEQGDPDRRAGVGTPHPRVLELIARAVGVELPPVPQWTPPVPPAPAQSKDLPDAVSV